MTERRDGQEGQKRQGSQTEHRNQLPTTQSQNSVNKRGLRLRLYRMEKGKEGGNLSFPSNGSKMSVNLSAEWRV